MRITSVASAASPARWRPRTVEQCRGWRRRFRVGAWISSAASGRPELERVLPGAPRAVRARRRAGGRVPSVSREGSAAREPDRRGGGASVAESASLEADLRWRAEGGRGSAAGVERGPGLRLIGAVIPEVLRAEVTTEVAGRHAVHRRRVQPSARSSAASSARCQSERRCRTARAWRRRWESPRANIRREAAARRSGTTRRGAGRSRRVPPGPGGRRSEFSVGGVGAPLIEASAPVPPGAGRLPPRDLRRPGGQGCRRRRRPGFERSGPRQGSREGRRADVHRSFRVNHSEVGVDPRWPEPNKELQPTGEAPAAEFLRSAGEGWKEEVAVAGLAAARSTCITPSVGRSARSIARL